MKLSPFFKINRGITAIIGGGGKTTLLCTLAEELRALGSVILCTSTKMIAPPQYEVLMDAPTGDIRAALREYGVLCVGSKTPEGKLSTPAQTFVELAALADFLLVEADGAHRLPLKAHAPHEPVIPPESGQVICVLGAKGFGRPISEVCHRPERYSALCGMAAHSLITPELAARVLRAEGLGNHIYINQVEDDQDWERARRLAALLDCPVTAGSLHKGVYRCLR